MDLNGTACYQHCSNGITMCVQNQWAFLKVEILNGIIQMVYQYKILLIHLPTDCHDFASVLACR